MVAKVIYFKIRHEDNALYLRWLVGVSTSFSRVFGGGLLGFLGGF